jgi:hypothetical protein
VAIPWDIDQYHSKRGRLGPDKLKIKYPNPNFGEFSDPLTVVDVKGRIILWYLPGLLSLEQQVGVSS